MTEHFRGEDTVIPKNIRIAMAMVDRVGFPIAAFLLMSYVAWLSIQNINENTKVLIEMRASMIAFQGDVSIQHAEMLRDLRKK